MPWIPEHGDTLMLQLESGGYQLAAFDLIKNVEDNQVRREAARFARERPDLYRRMIVRRLIPLRGQVNGFVLTFDWAPVMRIIVEVCRELGIPTILIPHESVFIDRDLYYTDITSKASVPLCDLILTWGEMQRGIFVERGYPAERIISVGAPKFDAYRNYRPKLDRQLFHRLYGLRGDKKTILFASQPLDSQSDTVLARESQRKAIGDLLAYAQASDVQLIVRSPPSKDDILGRTLREELTTSPLTAIDDAHCFLVEPIEAVHHADVVTSVNSTMLFEAVLSDRPAVSMKYIAFDSQWDRVGIPAATDFDEAAALLDATLANGFDRTSLDLEWAAQQFGVGTFDGRAAERIRLVLTDIASGERLVVPVAQTAIDRVFSNQPLDVIAIPSSDQTLATTQQYLLPLMNARTLVTSGGGDLGLQDVASAELFLQWGLKENPEKLSQTVQARALGKQILIVEDGFVRSVGIGLSGEPGLSVLLDDTTAYYDATTPSRLERLLEAGPRLSAAEKLRARSAIDKIVASRVSKYNHAPDIQIQVGSAERPKVLLVDQRFEDQSVLCGGADETTFERMLADALREKPSHDILIKQHPDAITGGKSSYFSDERLAVFRATSDRIHTVAFDINPFALFDLVDEVYVATSGMGFEALLAGKTVHCYGTPFYSGWGLTQDRLPIERRTRARTIEDVFHFTYIDSSRYYHPGRAARVEVEELVDYIARKRDAGRLILEALTEAQG